MKNILLPVLLSAAFVLTGAETFSPVAKGQPCIEVKVLSHEAPVIRAENEFRALLRAGLGISDYDGNRGYYTLQLAVAGDGTCDKADEAMKNAGLSYEKLGPEGFLLAKDTKRSYILCAYSGKGVLNGVYKNLEKTLGIVSPRPLAALEFPFPAEKVTPLEVPFWEAPAFPVRGLSVSGATHRNPQNDFHDWMGRNLMNFRGLGLSGYLDMGWSLKPYGFQSSVGGHSFHQWLPPSEYFAKHPEYYALLNGKRSAASKGAQITLGNPEVIDIIVEKMIAYKKQYPEMKVLPFGYNDSWTNGFGWGDDPLDLKLDSPNDLPKPDSKRPRTYSTRYIKAANQVIERVNKVYPDVKLAVYAYHFSMMQPPDAPVHPNLVVAFAPLYKCCRHAINDPMCPRNKLINEYLVGWSKKTKNIVIRDYYMSTNFNTPLMPLYLIQKELQYYKSLGLLGATPETNPDGPNGANVYGKEYFKWLRRTPQDYELSWDSAGLSHFALARLLWNPDEKLEDIVGIYCRNYYGPEAGKSMALYHLAVDKNIELSSHPGEKPAKPEKGDFLNSGEWCVCWNWEHQIGNYAAELFQTRNPSEVGKNAMPLLNPLYQAWKDAFESDNRLVVERVGRDMSLMEKYLLSSGYELSRSSLSRFEKPRFNRTAGKDTIVHEKE